MTVNKVGLILMPISHAVAWYLVLKTYEEHGEAFYNSIALISAFYCAWAIYKINVQGDKNEKGHISMGYLYLTSTLFGSSYPYIVAVGNVLVIINFGVVIPYFVKYGVSGIVKAVHKDTSTLSMIWGYVFLTFLIGNIILWHFTLKTILQL